MSIIPLALPEAKPPALPSKPSPGPSMSREQRIGLQGEFFALEQLARRGYDARLVSDWFADTDIILESLCPVEVKLSYPLAGQQLLLPMCWSVQ